MKAGRFDAAKEAYEEALELEPKSEEAQKGLDKASNLRMANVGYSQHISTAKKYLDEGRIPLATKFFNKALASRPSNLSIGQKEEEAEIRDALAMNRQKVSVTIVSDNKTYVSLIGVFAPEQFKEKKVLLYPDVYTFRGTRKDHRSVELEVKVSQSSSLEVVEVICGD